MTLRTSSRFRAARLGAGVALAVAALCGWGAPDARAADAGTPPAGPLTMTPASGDSSTQFVLKPVMDDDPAAAFCPGDSATQNYRWQTFITPASIDPATLDYNTDGPVPQAGEATWPLYSPEQTPIVNQNTGVGDGLVLASGQPLSFGVFPADVLPNGDYSIGIACSLFGETTTYWTLPITLSDGAAIVNYAPTAAARPAPPALTDPLTVGDGALTVAFTQQSTVPPVTSFTVTAVPTGGGASVTKNGTASPITVDGLTNDIEYTVTVTATNENGTSDPSNALTGSPLAVPPASSSTTVETTTTTAPPDTSSSTTTTTTAGSTTTTSSTSTTTPPSSSTSTSVASAGALPRTGGASTPIVVWAVLLLVFGRIIMLLGRTPRVLPPKR